MEYTALGGRLRHIAVPSTAGNLVYTALTPGSGFRWMLLYARLKLITDATVANRTLNIVPRDGSSNSLTSPRMSAVITASLTAYLSLVGSIGLIAGSYQDGSVFAIDPFSMIIEGSDFFQIDVSNGVAGDAYSGFITVLEVPA